MKKKMILMAVLVIIFAMKADKPAYKMFTAKGKNTTYSNLLKDAKDADIILFGELHNNPICHWLEYELTKDLYEIVKEKLILGAEMFEADNQLLIDEYITRKFDRKQFESQARLWPNHNTDYRPLIDFAADSNLRFIATNIPRRYASIVSQKGFEGLDELKPEAKNYIAPLPIKYDPELDCYKKMLNMMGSMGGRHMNPNLPKAQAIKDATMAHFILKNWTKGDKFLHYNGSYHSDNFQSIVWYLKQQNPDLKILTIASVTQDDCDKLLEENENKADYIICIPESMTPTY
ncbi:MAG: ChaN family lipoprotein [Saprospiraceae bacterium]|nr:ChaN family lipoprotein [Saprospiraceae bacterium]